MVDQLRALAIKAAREATDDSCRGIYSLIIWTTKEYLELIEKEVEGHKKKNKWD